MRIAQFTSSLIEPLGGAEQYCLSLARHQKQSGHDVEVLAGWVDTPVRAALEAEGIPVRVIPTTRPYSPDKPGGSTTDKLRFHAVELLDSVRRTGATKMIERGGYDVLHVHRFAGFGTGVLRARGPRVVHTVHDYTLVDTSASLVRDGRLITGTSRVQKARAALIIGGLSPRTTIVFPSTRTRDRHTEFGFPTAVFDSRVIPHGWPRPAPLDAAHRLPATDGALNVLFLGKLSEHKGVPLMLAAWGDGIPGVVLRVGGDGVLAGDVASRPGVEALGWLDERARTAELARADVLVFPSTWPENFPIVVAEAILASTPVITTTVASPPLVDDGESGLLVAPTATALRAGLQRLTEEPGLLAALSTGAAERARQLDMDVHGAAVLEAYRGIA